MSTILKTSTAVFLVAFIFFTATSLTSAFSEKGMGEMMHSMKTMHGEKMMGHMETMQHRKNMMGHMETMHKMHEKHKKHNEELTESHNDLQKERDSDEEEGDDENNAEEDDDEDDNE